MRPRYSFEQFNNHSLSIVEQSRHKLKSERREVRKAFQFLLSHFERLDRGEKTLSKNVKLMLCTRFINHLYASLLLADRGLVVDAITVGRNAVEVTALYWLICKDPGTADLYASGNTPKPVEVRKRLEKAGIDIEELRSTYSLQSGVVHPTSEYQHLWTDWVAPQEGRLLVGGGFSLERQRALYKFIPSAIVNFARYDENYSVEVIEP